MSRLKAWRREQDFVVAALRYYRQPQLGTRRLAQLLGHPRSTIADALRRVDVNDPETRRRVRAKAVALGLPAAMVVLNLQEGGTYGTGH